MALLCRIFPRLPPTPVTLAPVVQQRVTIKDLSVEILFMIVSHISREDLGNLAQVNHGFNSLLTRRLWTSVRINLQADPGTTYGAFTRFFQFVARDQVRAQNLRELTLIMKLGRYRSTRHSIGQIGKALHLLPNLQLLHIRHSDRHIPNMLCHPPLGQPWPFKLRAFACLLKHPEEIIPFLHQQPSIEDCNILSAYGSPGERSPCLDLAPFAVSLPHIRRISCSWKWFKPFFQGRDLLFVGFDVTHDLLENAAQRSNSTQLQPGTINSEQVRVCVTGESNLLHWLPQLIQQDVGVQLQSIRTLLFEGYSPLTRLVADTLTNPSSFPNLEEIRWRWFRSHPTELEEPKIAEVARFCASRNPKLQLIKFGLLSVLSPFGQIERVWRRDRDNGSFHEVYVD
ncbi:hypothetical protein DL93DRAFT_1296431 [Clavulina sp. PMI_390]|nr:hypothetical protein DL93DRAFT_1296431 [Clavulina sp. PMI_390]